MNTHPPLPADPLPPSWMGMNNSAARQRLQWFLDSSMLADFRQPEPLSPLSLAAARENLDGAIAALLEAATAEVCGESQLAPPAVVVLWCEFYIPSDRPEDQRLRELASRQGLTP